MKTLHISVIIGVVFVIVGFVFVPIFTSKPMGFRFTGDPFEDVKNNCNDFYTVPENQSKPYVAPVILMDSNSTACAKLTFTIVSNYDSYNDTTLLSTLRQLTNFRIGNYDVTTDGHSFSITPGKDHTNSFNILSTRPIYDDPTNHKVGTNFTITYFIQALPSAKGFYDYSIPRANCSYYPLAVGYTADQVNSSDFSKVSPLGQTCEHSPYEITSIQISGMSYKELQLEPISFELEK